MPNDSEIDYVGTLRRGIVKFVSSCNFKMSESNCSCAIFKFTVILHVNTV